ncbi:DNA-binding transcriptional regulator, LysR family [Luteibacter sp. UNCMF331Sha3.1]|uniref:LysR family transcriptional regulator n=1 Tax=Luteibacter sp. UNCMF331Sha3.1 TaxID=1502760 RepID=UPI0008B89B05|nr:LysR family transcriptional regulator [Luteibacter sp. UNCMF331Sha3.1]SEM52874.1 DNA-binding transcriptional regulator, LysR family [Luteibacter sp. UNCMF331Sha3.1]
MEWSDLRIFLAVARNGTLGAAARELGQTQPTMGRRIRALEASLGLALFQRTSEGFVLTDEGRAVLAHAEQMEAHALGIAREASGQGGALDGMLRVSSSDWFGAHVLTHAVASMRRRHPGVSVELVTDSRLVSLARREADLVFRIAPFDEPDIAQRLLLSMPYAAYVADDLPDGVPALITMDTAFGTMPDVAWLRARRSGAVVAFRSNSREAQARACALGVGIAVLPTPLGDSTPGIRRIDLGGTPPERDMWLGYHRDLRHVPRLRAFVAEVDRLLDDGVVPGLTGSRRR